MTIISKNKEFVNITCCKCYEIKRVEDFNNYSKSECRECVRIRVLKWKRDNPDKVKIYQRNWIKKHPNHRKEWDKNHPEVYRVKERVRESIKKGIIKRPEICEKCNGGRKIVAHHEDYNKPLDINWVCHSCHKLIHNQKRGIDEQALQSN